MVRHPLWSLERECLSAGFRLPDSGPQPAVQRTLPSNTPYALTAYFPEFEVTRSALRSVRAGRHEKGPRLPASASRSASALHQGTTRGITSLALTVRATHTTAGIIPPSSHAEAEKLREASQSFVWFRSRIPRFLDDAAHAVTWGIACLMTPPPPAHAARTSMSPS